MKPETIAIHSGYEVDPTTKAVAVPIYQTVAYAFDSAEHAAALFNLEAEGFRYTRIQNPTTAVLERRVAALEGGLEAMCVSSGQAAVNYAVLNVTELGCNIVSVPQLYGTTHTLFAHVLPGQGVTVRFAESEWPHSSTKRRERSFAKVLGIQQEISATSMKWRAWLTIMGFRSSLTTLLPRPFFCSPLSTALTSW